MLHPLRVSTAAPLLSALALLLAGGCDGDVGNGPENTSGQVDRVVIQPGQTTLVFLGERYRLVAKARDADGVVIEGLVITWQSSDPATVDVGTNGEVTARKTGQVTITASVGDVRGHTVVAVDVSQAATRCTNCHGPTAGHRLFPGAACPDCHLPAFLSFLGTSHEAPLRGHGAVARGFTLLGVHDTLACDACHQPPAGPPRFQPADTADCVACHEADYQSRHAGSTFPRTCPVCHSTDSFRGARYDHESSSAKFRLIGVHTTLACSSCHAPNGAPLFTPQDQNDCVACHAADYQRKHAGSGYPTLCTGCHTPTQWLGATFNHSIASGGRFTLVGVHLTRPCTVCHDATTGAPKFAPRDQDDCVTCHAADYQRKHAGSGYPTTCLVCHTTTSFLGAAFNHDASYFAIYSGTHRGRWSSCATCHTVPSDFSQFTCWACHSQSEVEGEHRSRPGYSPTACPTCHRNP